MLNLPRRWLLSGQSILVEEGRAEVIKRTFVVMHHHVALASLEVCQGELRVVHAGIGKLVKSLVKLLLFLVFFHLWGTRLATLGLLNDFKDPVCIIVFFDILLYV